MPNIHKKWRQLAEALGLVDKDMSQIVVIPHGKQSRYAQMVLDIWLQKDKVKATKQKLSEALESVGARKALGKWCHCLIYNLWCLFIIST